MPVCADREDEFYTQGDLAMKTARLRNRPLNVEPV